MAMRTAIGSCEGPSAHYSNTPGVSCGSAVLFEQRNEQRKNAFIPLFREWHDSRCKCNLEHSICKQELNHTFNMISGYGVVHQSPTLEQVVELKKLNCDDLGSHNLKDMEKSTSSTIVYDFKQQQFSPQLTVIDSTGFKYGCGGIVDIPCFEQFYIHPNTDEYCTYFLFVLNGYPKWFVKHGEFCDSVESAWLQGIEFVKMEDVPKEVLIGYSKMISN